MASTIKIKRSASAGNAPNNTNIDTAELALNTADRIMYSSDGTDVFEIGANLTSLAVSGQVTLTNIISANGSVGTAGQALLTDGSGKVYWGSVSGGGAALRSDYVYTANEGQTTFTGADDDTNTLAINSSYFDVYINGSKISETGNFTSNTTAVVFTEGVGNNDIVSVTVYDTSALTSVDDQGVSTAITISNTNNIGIGGSETTVFNGVGGDMKFVVIGDDSTTTVANNSDAGIAIVNTNQTAGNLAGLHFARADTDNSPNYAGASIVAQFPDAQVTGQYPKGELAFLTSTATNYAPSEKMRIDSSGNVGIGQTSPSRLLEVLKSGGDDVNIAVIGGGSGAGGASVAIGASGTSSYIRGVNNGVGAYVPLNIGGSINTFEISASEKMRIDSNGDALIGTTVSDGALTIARAADALDGVSIRQNSAGSSAGARLKLGNNSDARDAEIVLTGSGNSSYAGARTLNFVSNVGGFGFYRGYTTPTATMVLDSSGNVGIGSVNGLDKLHVYEEVNSAIATQLLLQNQGSGNHAAGIAFQVTSSAEAALTVYAPKAAIIQERTASYGRGPIKFMQDNAADANPFGAGDEVMRIESSGNVGIGTSSPDFLLDVAGRIGILEGTNGIAFHDGAGSVSAGVRADSGDNLVFATGSSDTERMRINSSGNVGIGTSTLNGTLLVIDQNGTDAPSSSGNMNTGSFLGAVSVGGAALNIGHDADGTWYNSAYFNNAGVARIHRWLTGGTERMRIDTSGRLNVGGTTGAGRLNAIASNWPENALAVYSANVAGQTNFAGIAFYNQDTDSATGNVADIYTNPTGTLSLTSAANPAIQLKYGSAGISGGTAALTVDSSGNVGIGTASPAVPLDVVGNIRSSTGVLFGTDTAAANLLDDYEEGDWTPTIGTGTTVSTDAAYNAGFTGGHYTKVGEIVHCTATLRLTDKGTQSGAISILGLPFASANNVKYRATWSSWFHGGADVDLTGNTDGMIMMYQAHNTSHILVRVMDPAGTAGENVEFADISDTVYLQISGSYVAA